MKWLVVLLCLAVFGLVAFGPLVGRPAPERDLLYGSLVPILPMRFVHDDHFDVGCVTCHHEFVDGTAGPNCMTCHVTDPKVAPLLEVQFHALCRDCHVVERAAGKPSGPTRSCIGCHESEGDF